MRLKGGVPRFKIDHIQSFWDSKIPDLATLKELLPGSFLVAFDIESSPNPTARIPNVNEIGLAFLQAKEEENWPQLPKDGELGTFYDQNDIQAHSIQVRGRISKKNSGREGIKFGNKVFVDADQISQTMVQMLSARGHKGGLILAGFDLYTELEWISRQPPSFSSLFTAWVDLQEIALEHAGLAASAAGVGLLHTMHAMHIVDRKSDAARKKTHRASNDAVRCLAVLCGLISLDSFSIPSKPPKVLLLSEVPRLPEPLPPSKLRTANYKYPFTARIKATDGSALPAEFATPSSLSRLFAKYEPKAVAINSSAASKPNGVKIWWVELPCLESLERFTADVNGSTVQGKRLLVECSIIVDCDAIKFPSNLIRPPI